MHDRCICDKPNSNCPRYGWMKGRKWEHCQGINISQQDREIYLNIYSGKLPPQEPSIITKAINLIGAEIGYALSGFENVSKEIYNERKDICAKCSHLNNNAVCNLCGCPIEEKAMRANSECPDNPPRWKKINLPVITPVSQEKRPCCGG